VPVLGDVLRHTVSPLLGAALMPLVVKGMFAPRPVPERFKAGFSAGMAVRPSQIRAEAQDGATMAYGVAAMRDHYQDLRMPVVIVAGSEDRVVDVGRHAVRLRDQLPHADLRLVPGAGHMVHYAVPGEVAEAVEAVSGRSAAHLAAAAG
jgi:pimeloyl-ACP methyl ester carboxylesterase